MDSFDNSTLTSLIQEWEILAWLYKVTPADSQCIPSIIRDLLYIDDLICDILTQNPLLMPERLPYIPLRGSVGITDKLNRHNSTTSISYE